MKSLKLSASKAVKTLVLACIVLSAGKYAYCSDLSVEANSQALAPISTTNNVSNLADQTTLKQIDNVVSQTAKDSVSLQPQILKTENNLTPINAVSTKPSTPLVELKAEQTSGGKAKEGSDVIKLQLEQNIFNLPVEKKFESGILRDIKLVGGQDVVLQHFMPTGQVPHTFVDGKIFLIGINGHFRDDANTQFNLTIAPTLQVDGYSHLENMLFEYYLNRQINKHVSLRVGQQRTPNLVEGSRSVFGLPVGRRARFAGTYSNITAIGAQVFGNYDRYEYRAGVFDSGRFMKYTFDDMPEVAGMLTFKPIKNTQKYGQLRIGGSYDVGRRHTDYSVVGAHASYDYKKLHLDSEFGYADGYSGRTISTNKSFGYHVTALYDIHPKVQGFCRLDYLNPNTALTKVASNEYTIGMHYYLKGKKTRLTLSYIFLDNQTGPNSNRLFSMIEFLP